MNTSTSTTGGIFAEITARLFNQGENISDGFASFRSNVEKKRAIGRLKKNIIRDTVFLEAFSKKSIQRVLNELTEDYQNSGFKINNKMIMQRLSPFLQKELVDDHMNDMIVYIAQSKKIKINDYALKLNQSPDPEGGTRSDAEIHEKVLCDYFTCKIINVKNKYNKKVKNK